MSDAPSYSDLRDEAMEPTDEQDRVREPRDILARALYEEWATGIRMGPRDPKPFVELPADSNWHTTADALLAALSRSTGEPVAWVKREALANLANGAHHLNATHDVQWGYVVPLFAGAFAQGAPVDEAYAGAYVEGESEAFKFVMEPDEEGRCRACMRPLSPGAQPSNPERVAQLLAHRVCLDTEHDPANGKLHGCCVVCGVPWPCVVAQPSKARREEYERLKLALTEAAIESYAAHETLWPDNDVQDAMLTSATEYERAERALDAFFDAHVLTAPVGGEALAVPNAEEVGG